MLPSLSPDRVTPEGQQSLRRRLHTGVRSVTGPLEPQEESKELLRASDIQKVGLEEGLSQPLLSEAGLKPHFLQFDRSSSEHQRHVAKPAGICLVSSELLLYWEAKGDLVSWIHAYNKLATHLIAQQG